MVRDGSCLPEGAQRAKQPQHHRGEKAEVWGALLVPTIPCSSTAGGSQAAAAAWSQRGFWLFLTSRQLQAAPAAPQALAAVLLRAPAAFTCASTLR